LVAFAKYIKRFENEVVVTGIERRLLGKLGRVSSRRSRLAETAFAALLGDEVDSDVVFAIDYYGFFKKSRGLNSNINEGLVTVVHFNAIRLETIVHLAPDIAPGFGSFKKCLLDARGLPHSYREM
jgi:hypothetical protein